MELVLRSVGDRPWLWGAALLVSFAVLAFVAYMCCGPRVVYIYTNIQIHIYTYIHTKYTSLINSRWQLTEKLIYYKHCQLELVLLREIMSNETRYKM